MQRDEQTGDRRPSTIPVLQIKLLTEHAIIPTRGSCGSAGYDLYAAENVVLDKIATVATDLAVVVPTGTYGRIAPRSSLAAKHVHVGGGVVDGDYRGNVKVILYNFSDHPFLIHKGDRIAQLILEQISQAEIEIVDFLDSTERNCGGFGSSGV